MTKYFGSSNRLKEYKILFMLGLSLIVIGFPFIFLNNIFPVLGAVLVFIGLMLIVSGGLGLREERKKSGVQIISTSLGEASLMLGLLSVATFRIAYASFLLGTIAILLGIRANKKGDNLYASGGLISGLIGVILTIYIFILFSFFV
jgi:hypothetical protein